MFDPAEALSATPWEDGVGNCGLDRLFLSARTVRHWLDTPVPTSMLAQLHELASLGPTSANCQPLRIVFVTSPTERRALIDCLDDGNIRQTQGAPVTAILGYDLQFADRLINLYPHQPQAKQWFTQSPAATREAALKNGSLQAGYFILAARALGLDCGPMGGFDADRVGERFFPQGGIEVNFLCNLGYGERSAMHERLPRLAFGDACRIV